MTEKDLLELLLCRAQDAREAQTGYFKQPNSFALKKAKAKEQALDEVIKQLKRRGYDGSRFAVINNVEKLF